jgi:hypothetical protein
LPNRAAIAVEVPLPELVADQHHVLAARPILDRAEVAADQRLES